MPNEPINNLLATPLTPEQLDMLRRQQISESWGPLDVLTPMGIAGGIGALAGRQMGRGFVRAGDALSNIMFPAIGTAAGMAGFDPRRGVNNAGRIGGTLGGLMGAGIGGGAAIDRRVQLNMPPMPRYYPQVPDEYAPPVNMLLRP